ncbi:hypothetical protein [Peribacillus frigoritolerans]|uniref:DUF1289 domain-containing protein n=1 Tax=Peribacillus castrilensis TaxID=2897690 RepID=A0AAW9NPC7_9BACI|nr:hypothetical protein [Peribacillus castrilensis]
MNQQTNLGCAVCDFFSGCSKRLLSESENINMLAKEQEQIKMHCVNIVQDICRDCVFFEQKKCASWKVLNGKEKSKGNLSTCPKRREVKKNG